MLIQERLSELLVQHHPADAAAILERLQPADAAATLGRLPAPVAGGALRHVLPATAAACLGSWPSDEQAGDVLATLPRDVAARVLLNMSQVDRDALLRRAPRKTSEALRRQLRYTDGTAGALMDPRVLALPQQITVGDARRRVRRRTDHMLYYLYVLDAEHRLVGVLTLRELMSAAAASTLGAVMVPEVAHLSVHAGRAAIVTHPGWQRYHALPVIDGRDALVGVLRYETLRELEQESAPGGRTRGLELGLGLGELYWSAAFALLEGLLEIGTPTPPASQRGREDRHGDE